MENKTKQSFSVLFPLFFFQFYAFLDFCIFLFFCNFLFKYIIFYQLFENLKHVYYIVWLDLPPTLTSLTLEDSLLSIFSHFHDLFQFWFVSFKITWWMKSRLLTYSWTCQRPHHFFLNARNPVCVTHFLKLMDAYLSRFSVLSPDGDKYHKHLKFFPQEGFWLQQEVPLFVLCL